MARVGSGGNRLQWSGSTPTVKTPPKQTPKATPPAIQLAASPENEFDGKWTGTFVGESYCNTWNIPLEATVKDGIFSTFTPQEYFENPIEGPLGKDGKLSIWTTLTTKFGSNVHVGPIHFYGRFSKDSFQGDFNALGEGWFKCFGVIKLTRLGSAADQLRTASREDLIAELQAQSRDLKNQASQDPEEAARLVKLRQEQQEEAERLAKQRAEEEARLARVREEQRQEAERLAKRRAEEESRFAKLQEEQRQETERLAKQRAEEERRLAKLQEEQNREAARLAKQRAEDESRLAKLQEEQRQETERLAKRRAEEETLLAKLQEEQSREAERLAKQRAADEGRLAKLQEEQNLEAERLAKRRAEEEARLAKLRQEQRQEAKRLARQKAEAEDRARQVAALAEKQARKKADQGPTAGIEFGDYHALVIGIADYKFLPKLETAVNDAKAVSRTLKEDYGFKVSTLIDPDRVTIIDALDEYRETLGPDDNLLIYYAGHGWLDEDADRGYWLPVNAKPKRWSGWMSNGTITDTLKALNAKHVMLVADSCYSGTLVRGVEIETRTREGDYWKKMAAKWARVAITSGGLEPVADKGGGDYSPFAKAFIDALGDNDTIMDGTQLFSKLRRPVMVAAQQTPQYSDVRQAGHDGGDFLFVRKK